MKRIVAKTGGPTDTTIDYEYTNWHELYEFADQFRRLGGPAATHSGHAA
jgi:menaquinone-dependent protoporphyrinogen IX oxidase